MAIHTGLLRRGRERLAHHLKGRPLKAVLPAGAAGCASE
jgi:hypothetical protein